MPTRTLVLGALLAAMAAAALPMSVSAAPTPAASPYTLDLQLWQCYAAGGGAPGNVSLKVSLRRGATVVKSQTVQTQAGGAFGADFCDAGAKGRIRPGDTVTLFRSRSDQKTFTIPDVAPRIDVVAASASGTTPAGSLSITPKDCWSREKCLAGSGKVLLGGAWSTPLGGDVGGGGDLLELFWSGTDANTGLSVRARTPVPYFQVKAGSSTVTGAGRPNQKVKVTLKTRSGRVRASGIARAKGPDGAFTVKLRSHGSPVKVRVGDRVSSTLYAGAKLTVVKTDLTIDTGTGHVIGHCFKESSKVLASARKGLASVTNGLFTDTDRAFDLDATGIAPLTAAVTATAICANDQGNEQRFSATAS